MNPRVDVLCEMYNLWFEAPQHNSEPKKMNSRHEVGKDTYNSSGIKPQPSPADQPADEQRRRIVEKAIKVSAVAPVMLTLFSSKNAAAFQSEVEGGDF